MPSSQERLKPKILIIDDTPEDIAPLVAYLGKDFKINQAVSGAEGLRSVGSEPPDLILLDIKMPDLDGFAVFKILAQSEDTKNIPVMIISGHCSAENEVEALQSGAVDFIKKPFDLMVLKTRIETHLHLSIQKREVNRLVAQRTSELEEARINTVRLLVKAAGFRDSDTGFHIVRMSQYSRLISLAMGFDPEHAELVFNAAAMHDVGKIGIPDKILSKPAKLNDEEWAIMQGHTFIGSEIIGPQGNELLRLSAIIAMTHHEKWDGSGYPHGLKGEDIPIEGRITAIADVFDALTEVRPYKNAWSNEKAVDLIKSESGKHFDPALVDCFVQILPDILEIQELYSNA